MFRKSIGIVAIVAMLVTVMYTPDSAAKQPAGSKLNGSLDVKRNQAAREVVRDIKFFEDDDWLPDRGGGEDEPFDENEGHDWEGVQVVNPSDFGYLIVSIPWIGGTLGQIVPIWIAFQPSSNTPTTGSSSYIPKVPNQEKTDHGVKKGKERSFDTARAR